MNGLTGTRTALVAMLLAAVAMFAAGGARAADVKTDYVPLVSYFPKPVPRSAVSKPFVPFVTDFGRPAATPGPAADPIVAPKPLPVPARATGTDWANLGIAAALAALLAGSALVLARRANPRLARTPGHQSQH